MPPRRGERHLKMQDIKTQRDCPYCGSGFTQLRAAVVVRPPAYWIECTACAARGPRATTPARAVAKWNGRTYL